MRQIETHIVAIARLPNGAAITPQDYVAFHRACDTVRLVRLSAGVFVSRFIEAELSRGQARSRGEEQSGFHFDGRIAG